MSIFVNPKQFNKKKDFITYPNNLQNDLSICKKLKVDYVFIPNTQEIYRWNDKKTLTPKINNIMEDKDTEGLDCDKINKMFGKKSCSNIKKIIKKILKGKENVEVVFSFKLIIQFIEFFFTYIILAVSYNYIIIGMLDKDPPKRKEIEEKTALI